MVSPIKNPTIKLAIAHRAVDQLTFPKGIASSIRGKST